MKPVTGRKYSPFLNVNAERRAAMTVDDAAALATRPFDLKLAGGCPFGIKIFQK